MCVYIYVSYIYIYWYTVYIYIVTLLRFATGILSDPCWSELIFKHECSLLPTVAHNHSTVYHLSLSALSRSWMCAHYFSSNCCISVGTAFRWGSNNLRQLFSADVGGETNCAQLSGTALYIFPRSATEWTIDLEIGYIYIYIYELFTKVTHQKRFASIQEPIFTKTKSLKGRNTNWPSIPPGLENQLVLFEPFTSQGCQEGQL